MKLKTAAQLKAMEVPAPMSRKDKLDRWANLLETGSRAYYESLWVIEDLTDAELASVDALETPLQPLFEDEACRRHGIGEARTVGEAMRFLELDRDEIHTVLCYCHHGKMISAAEAAKNIRALLGGTLALQRSFGGLLH